MTASKTFYVRLFNRYAGGGRGKAGHWTTGVNVSDDPADRHPIDSHDLEVFEVECPTKAEAVGVLMRYLATDRPAAMTVRSLWRKP